MKFTNKAFLGTALGMMSSLHGFAGETSLIGLQNSGTVGLNFCKIVESEKPEKTLLFTYLIAKNETDAVIWASKMSIFPNSENAKKVLDILEKNSSKLDIICSTVYEEKQGLRAAKRMTGWEQ